MKLVRKTLIMSAAVASLCIGMVGTARADAFAQSILTINNFRLLHSNCTAFTPTDFDTLDGVNSAHAGASLNGVTSAAPSQDINILSGTALFPEPGTLAIFGLCLLGMSAFKRRSLS